MFKGEFSLTCIFDLHMFFFLKIHRNGVNACGNRALSIARRHHSCLMISFPARKVRIVGKNQNISESEALKREPPLNVITFIIS